MKKSSNNNRNYYEEKQWRNLRYLSTLAKNNNNLVKVPSPLTTSIDRLIEIKNVTQSVLATLSSYSIRDEIEINLIREELYNLRGILVDLANEFEAAGDEILLVAKNIKISVKEINTDVRVNQKEEYESSKEEFLKNNDSRNSSLYYDLTEVNDHTKININSKVIDVSNFKNIFKPEEAKIKPKLNNDQPPKAVKKNIQKFLLPEQERFREFINEKKYSQNESDLILNKLTDLEQLDFDALLLFISNSGIRVEDLRGRNKGVFISLDKIPSIQQQQAIKKLVSLGAKVWPGKKYLQI